MKLKQSLLIDRKINSRSSFLVLAIYRIEHFLYQRRMSWLLRLVGGGKSVIYLMLGLDAQISYKAVLGDYIRLPHKAMGVVISPKAIIGDHVSIFHHVTIGVNESLPKERQKIEIGNHCYLSTGCKVISCKVSDNCRIAPNAVVYKDISPNSLVFPVNEIKILKQE